MVSLKKTIEKSLRENVHLSDIKRELKEKGYKSGDITKAVREVIAGIDKGLPTATIIKIEIITVALLIVILFVGYQIYVGEKSPEISQSETSKTVLKNFVQDNLIGEYQPDVFDINETLIPNTTVYSYRWRKFDIGFNAEYRKNSESELLIYLSLPSDLTEITEKEAYGLYGKFFRTNNTWECLKRATNSSWACITTTENGVGSVISKYQNADMIKIVYRLKL